MKKQKLLKTFNFDELNSLVVDENSCVELLNLQEHIALHPYHLSDLNNSVKEILNSKIGKFCIRLDGILCGYKNIKLLSKVGQICEDSCYIHVDIEAGFFIFKPVVGKILEGFVHKKTKDHVGCLVHKIFNVSLPKPKKQEWIGENLNLGSRIQLEITSTNFEGKLPFIKGKIINVLDEGVNNKITFDVNIDTVNELATETNKKPKKNIFDVEELETTSKSKKKTKRKAEVDDTEAPVKKRRKKKPVEEEFS
ncbi:DNA-directed RNA polymerase I subunit RPA43 isoform X2 [Tribolium madens]|nr:DNA-directed RNA polymerase I subunit RPA43 isoform X2 [Tribolium madens]